jgi:hypothetical protein
MQTEDILGKSRTKGHRPNRASVPNWMDTGHITLVMKGLWQPKQIAQYLKEGYHHLQIASIQKKMAYAG